MSRKIPNASEMGQVGGKKNVEKHGVDHMAEISQLGVKAMRDKYKGTDYWKELSRKGVEARKRKKRSSLEKVASILNGE